MKAWAREAASCVGSRWKLSIWREMCPSFQNSGVVYSLNGSGRDRGCRRETASISGSTPDTFAPLLTFTRLHDIRQSRAGGPAGPMGHTGGVDIEISQDSIRLGQLLKFASVVMDGGEAKALIAGGDVSVDGEPETRRGRQVRVGSVVEVELPHGRQELRVVAAEA